MKKTILFLLICIGTFAAKAQTTISIKEIEKHIGETVTICDSVYTTRALPGLTLINVGASFPNQLLTVIINKADLSKFTEPEKMYLNKKICVTGKLVLFKDKPQIVVSEPKQIG